MDTDSSLIRKRNRGLSARPIHTKISDNSDTDRALHVDEREWCFDGDHDKRLKNLIAPPPHSLMQGIIYTTKMLSLGGCGCCCWWWTAKEQRYRTSREDGTRCNFHYGGSGGGRTAPNPLRGGHVVRLIINCRSRVSRTTDGRV